jgi:uncharacterized caspase-like protein
VAGKRSALIVATSDYKDTRLPALPGPAEDATALRAVLSNPAIGGFDVRVALNSRVETLRRTLETFFADRARDDLLLVHFSGHGLKDDDGQLFLTGTDTRLDRLLSTGIDAAWLNRLISRCRAETIGLFLDCCFAGAFTSGLTRRAAGDSAGVKDVFQARGLVVITASDAMQYAFEGGRQIGEPPAPSPFTKALVDGLLTGAADRNEDGEVSINELFDFVEERVYEISPSQTPTKTAFNQVGDWVIARSARPAKASLPIAVQAQLASENSIDRFNALFDLQSIAKSPDPAVAGAGLEAIQRLAQDDSQRVSARARQILDEQSTRTDVPAAAPTTPQRPERVPKRAGTRRTPGAEAVVGADASAKAPEIGTPPGEERPLGPTEGRRRIRPAARTSIVAGAVIALIAVLTVALAVGPWERGTGGVASSTQSAPSTPSIAAAASSPDSPPPTASIATPAPVVPTDTLGTGESLTENASGIGAGGSRLLDASGTWELFFSESGDVRLEGHDKVVGWAARVKGAHLIRVRSFGVLEITNVTGATIWTSNPPQPAGDYYLLLQDDGNLLLRVAANDALVWKSQSDGGCFGGDPLYCGGCEYHCSGSHVDRPSALSSVVRVVRSRTRQTSGHQSS